MRSNNSSILDVLGGAWSGTWFFVFTGTHGHAVNEVLSAAPSDIGPSTAKKRTISTAIQEMSTIHCARIAVGKSAGSLLRFMHEAYQEVHGRNGALSKRCHGVHGPL